MTTPETRAPQLICPGCDKPLVYRQTVLNGVNPIERWDFFRPPRMRRVRLSPPNPQAACRLTTMPWTCPACNIQIQHEQDRPLPRKVYRCHVCRLELVRDERNDQLVVAPWGLRLIAGSEGPALISLAASHLVLLSVYSAAHVVGQFDPSVSSSPITASSASRPRK